VYRAPESGLRAPGFRKSVTRWQSGLPPPHVSPVPSKLYTSTQLPWLALDPATLARPHSSPLYAAPQHSYSHSHWFDHAATAGLILGMRAPVCIVTRFSMGSHTWGRGSPCLHAPGQLRQPEGSLRGRPTPRKWASPAREACRP
jgi:hypothetical protein